MSPLEEKPKMIERMAIVETRQEGLEDMVNRLIQKMDALVDSDLKNRRAPWGLLLTACALTVTIVGTIGSSWIAPINVQITSMEKRIERLSEFTKETRQKVDTIKR